MEKQRDKAARRMQRKLGGEPILGASDELMAEGDAAGPPSDDLEPAGEDLGSSADTAALEKTN
jgi:hypothetical protein